MMSRERAKILPNKKGSIDVMPGIRRLFGGQIFLSRRMAGRLSEKSTAGQPGISFPSGFLPQDAEPK